MKSDVIDLAVFFGAAVVLSLLAIWALAHLGVFDGASELMSLVIGMATGLFSLVGGGVILLVTRGR